MSYTAQENQDNTVNVMPSRWEYGSEKMVSTTTHNGLYGLGATHCHTEDGSFSRYYGHKRLSEYHVTVRVRPDLPLEITCYMFNTSGVLKPCKPTSVHKQILELNGLYGLL